MNTTETGKKGRSVRSETGHGTVYRGPQGTAVVWLEGVEAPEFPVTKGRRCWILPLDDLAMVRAAEGRPEERLWLAPCPPRKFLGALEEEFQGAWFEGDELHVRVGSRTARFWMLEPDSRNRTLQLLSMAAGLLWEGLGEREAAARLRAV